MEYNRSGFTRSDLNVPVENGFYKLTYPVRNVPKSRSFLASSKVFRTIDFQEYTFAVQCSIFYSFLSSADCYMTQDFSIVV